MNDLLLKLPDVKIKTSIQVLVLSIVFFALATLLKPRHHYAQVDSNLEQTIPRVIGEWVEVPQPTPQVSVVSDERSLVNQLYDDTLMRTYVDKEGHQIMVALAYAKEQRQDVKIHQPDICYPAQGYQMIASENVEFKLSTASNKVLGKRQLYESNQSQEAVSYWIRIGDQTSISGLQSRYKIIRDGLINNRYDDGILVRVSSKANSNDDVNKLYKLHTEFFDELTKSIAFSHPRLLLPV